MLIAVQRCPKGSFDAIAIKIGMICYTLVSVYGPNEDNPNFYESLEECVDLLPTENIIMSGDWNFVMDTERDSNYIRENNTNAKTRFIETTRKYMLIDVWRQLHPHEKQFSWWKPNPRKCLRLDMLLTSDNLLNNMTSCTIEPGYRTDHNILDSTFQHPNLETGPGL